jgi:hypothetical protein
MNTATKTRKHHRIDYSFKESICTKKDIIHTGKSNPAIVDIFKRLEKKGIEEVMKFEFDNEANAARFVLSLCSYRHSHNINAKISRCDCNVYLYKPLP